MCRPPNAHDIILNRAMGAMRIPWRKSGRAVADSLLAGGVLPIIKHIPGHGRATLDSHLELPRVDASPKDLQTDFTPFRRLSDLPMAMTAHILYPALRYRGMRDFFHSHYTDDTR